MKRRKTQVGRDAHIAPLLNDAHISPIRSVGENTIRPRGRCLDPYRTRANGNFSSCDPQNRADLPRGLLRQGIGRRAAEKQHAGLGVIRQIFDL